MIKANKTQNFQTFTDKMIISTSKEDRKILLWDENTCSVVYTYEDDNIKTFIPNNKIVVVGQDLYSEYIIALQENKSLVSIWKTNASECAIKCSPVDERMTAIDISMNNKLLFISTETGFMYIFELFSGNLLNSIQISGGTIYESKSLLKDAGLVIILLEDYIKLYKLENLIDSESNSNSLYEIPNYDNFSKMIPIMELKIVIFYINNNHKNISKIMINSLPDLKNLKNVYLNGENITSVIHSYSDLFLTSETHKIFKIDLSEIINHDVISINLNTNGDSGNEFNIFPVIQSDSKITFTTVTSKNILLGHEDGKISIYNKNNSKLLNTFSQHKGYITNIKCINKPISQYGLNFNIAVEETIVKSLKKPSIAYNHLYNVKNSVQNEDQINLLLTDYLEEYSYQNYEGNNTSTKNNLFVQIGKGSNKNSINLNDNDFLRKKINELYSIINN